MRVGLFIPCYIDQLYPHVGMAAIKVLEQFGVEVDFPRLQTCCGQPLATLGCVDDARPLAHRFARVFAGYRYVVAPSASCVAMVRHHYDELLGDSSQLARLKGSVFELCEFLTDVLELDRVEGRFPYRVGLHASCHGLRELGLGSPSELVGGTVDKTRLLLAALDGIEFADLQRPDECCGFGGIFSITEEAVACATGTDRLRDHESAGTQVLTANDMSCLMHLSGLIRRREMPMAVMHVAEILAGSLPAAVERLA